MPKVTELHINGKSYSLEADADESLNAEGIRLRSLPMIPNRLKV